MNSFLSLTRTALWLVVVSQLLIMPAQAQVSTFLDLPPGVRSQVGTGTPKKSSQIGDSPFGVHTTYLQENGGDPAPTIKMASEAGFKWVMDYISIPGNFEKLSLAELEDAIDKGPLRGSAYGTPLKANGIRLIVRIDFLPFGFKISKPEEVTPELKQKIALYTRKMLADLKPHTNHWQLWNEPNIGNENPLVSPEVYAELARYVAGLIREAQPNAVIYGPGTAMLQALAPWPYPWISRTLKAGLAKDIDVFSFHAYRQPVQRDNIPEHASEFHPWKTWGTYDNQLVQLRKEIRDNNNGRDLPLANLEDGYPNFIDSSGQQQISFIVGAKYELRKMLLDFKNQVSPHIAFCFYRPIKDPFYESEASYNMLVSETEAKPIYYATQNLTAVLDSSYKLETQTSTQLKPDTATPASVTPASATPDNAGFITQIYSKRYPATANAPAFTELLVFFWNAQVASDVHPNIPASLQVSGAGWQAPLLIDLMSMPAPRVGGGLEQIINPAYKDRLQPTMPMAEKTEAQLTVKGLQVRDYPMLLKLVRIER